MLINECLKPETEVYLTRDREYKKGLFYKDEERELFIKDFNHAELIGEELCSVRKLKCAHYFVVGCGMEKLKRTAKYGTIREHYKYKIASFDFKDKDKTYKLIKDYKNINYYDVIGCMLDNTESRKNRDELYFDLMNLIALDIYMGQTDRTAYNYMFEEDQDKNIRLAPLFDFEYSLDDRFLDQDCVHDSSIVFFEDYIDAKNFIRDYPELGDILKSYLDEDLCGTTTRAFAKRNLKVPEYLYPQLEKFREERCQTIKKIIK